MGRQSSTGEFLQVLRDGIPRTRSELAELSGLSRPTVATHVDQLLRIGLIAPAGEAASTGGRPPARVALNPGAQLVMGADVGATHVRIAVCDLAGMGLAQDEQELSVADGPEVVLEAVAVATKEIIRKIDRPLSDLGAVGVGLPGPVNHANGRPADPPIMPGWNNYDVPGYLAGELGVPVLVDNDVNVMALGERALHWPRVQDMIFVKVATGIGAGIISGGVLQRGANGTAGDIGHIAVPRAADMSCRCGKTACIEAFAGAPGIAAALQEDGFDVASADAIVDLVRSGNLRAASRVREAGRAIGEMLSACISFANPSLIIVGGRLADAEENLLAGIREEVYARSTPLATQDLLIAHSRSGAAAGVTGAATLAAEHVLGPKQVDEAVSAEQLASSYS